MQIDKTVLYKFKNVCEENIKLMNEISSYIKETESFFKKLMKNKSICYIDENYNFKIFYSNKNKRLMYESNFLSRPLIECPIEVRKMVIAGKHLDKLIQMAIVNLQT